MTYMERTVPSCLYYHLGIVACISVPTTLLIEEDGKCIDLASEHKHDRFYYFTKVKLMLFNKHLSYTIVR